MLAQPLTIVFLGGGLGCVLRYLLGKWLSPLISSMGFPLATLLVNLVASALLGWLMGLILARMATEEWRWLMGVAFCGGLSTFSGFSYETVVLIQHGRPWMATLNVLANLTLCTLAIVSGLWMGQR